LIGLLSIPVQFQFHSLTELMMLQLSVFFLRSRIYALSHVMH
jgi:hypothetical protein